MASVPPQRPLQSFGEYSMPVGNQPRYPGMPLQQAQQEVAQSRAQMQQGMQSRLQAYRSTSNAPTMQGVPAPMPRVGLSGMPMEQQGFAQHQLGGLQQASPAAPVPVQRDAYGLASRQNFTPSMSPQMAAGGAPGELGSVGNATLYRRPGEMQPGLAGSQMSLMGGNADRQYGAMMRDGVPAQSALRQVQNDARIRQTGGTLADGTTVSPSAQFQSQVAREQTRNAATRSRNSDLRGLAQARRLGVQPDKEMLGRLGGNGQAGANVGLGGNISGDQFSKLMDGQAQEGHRGVFGFRPNEQSSYTHTADVLKGIEGRFSHFDNAGKREYAAAVRAATLSPRFQANTPAGKKILDWLAKNGGGAPATAAPAGQAQASVPPQSPLRKRKTMGDEYGDTGLSTMLTP
jgi:hypothetical protein